MKVAQCLVFMVAGALAAAAPGAVSGPIGVSKACPRYFADAAGRGWIPIGCNICFDRLERDAAGARALFDGWMTAFAANGGNFMRVWLSCPFLDVMPEAAGAFSQEATDNLKWLVARAEALGLRLKFTFENFRAPGAPVDRNAAAGVVSFRDPAYAAAARTMRDVFTRDACAEIYLAKARRVAEAVGRSDALVAVELWNEIDSTGVARDVLGAWSERMLAALARLFPGKMTLQNLGSFSEAGAFADYDWLAAQKGNAFLQAHRYLDPGAALDVCRGPMDVLCADAIRELRDRRRDLPAVLAETGAVEPRHTGPSHLYRLDAKGLLLHDEIFAPFFAGAAGGGQPWHWDHQYISLHGLWHHFRRFAKAVEGLDPVAEDFRPFRTETARLRVWGLRGRKTTVVWLRDKRATREDLLERGLPPPVVEGARLPVGAAAGAAYDWYLPWADAACRRATPDAPAFAVSAVVRFQTARAETGR